jgi:hypothetical protein
LIGCNFCKNFLVNVQPAGGLILEVLELSHHRRVHRPPAPRRFGLENTGQSWYEIFARTCRVGYTLKMIIGRAQGLDQRDGPGSGTHVIHLDWQKVPSE